MNPGGVEGWPNEGASVILEVEETTPLGRRSKNRCAWLIFSDPTSGCKPTGLSCFASGGVLEARLERIGRRRL